MEYIIIRIQSHKDIQVWLEYNIYIQDVFSLSKIELLALEYCFHGANKIKGNILPSDIINFPLCKNHFYKLTPRKILFLLTKNTKKNKDV